MPKITKEEQREAAEAIAELQRLLRGPKENLSTMPADKVAYPVGLNPNLVDAQQGKP